MKKKITLITILLVVITFGYTTISISNTNQPENIDTTQAIEVGSYVTVKSNKSPFYTNVDKTSVLFRLDKGARVTLVEQTSSETWKVSYAGMIGYMNVYDLNLN